MPSTECWPGWLRSGLKGVGGMLFGIGLVLPVQAFNTAQLRTEASCTNAGSGKLIELAAFSGKMLDAAVLVTHGEGVVDDPGTPSSGVRSIGSMPSLGGVASNGARKISSDSSGGLGALVERPGSGGRRILWRQIQ